MPIDFDTPPGQAPPKNGRRQGIDFDTPPTPPPPSPDLAQRVVGGVGRTIGNYWEDYTAANKRSGAVLDQALHGFVTPPKSAHMKDLAQSHFLEAGPVVAAALNRIGDPLTAPFVTTFGRPVEAATGGAVSKDVVGNYAALLVPVLGELSGLSDAAKIARVAKEFKVSRPVAEAILSKSMATKSTLVSRVPGIVERAGHAIKETGRAIGRARRGEFEEGEITPETRRIGEQQGQAFVRRLVKRRDPTGKLLTENVAEGMGKPVTSGEALGREAQSHLTMVGRRAGATADRLEPYLEGRAEDMPRRVLEDFGEATKLRPEEIEGDFDAASERAKQENPALYKEAVDDVGALDSDTLRQLSVRPSMQAALKRAYRNAQEAGVNPEEIGLIVSPTKHVVRNQMGELDVEMSMAPIEVSHPTMQTWDWVKKALGAEIRHGSGMRNKETGLLTDYGVKADQTLKALRDELFKLNPKYEKLMETVGDPIRQREAFKESEKLFGAGTSEFQFSKRLKNMSESDRRAVLAGAVKNLYNKARNSTLNLNKLFPPSYRTKLAQLMGSQEEADALFKKVDVERKIQKGGSRMMPGTGSHTFELESSAESMDREMGGAVQRAGRRVISRPNVKGLVEGVWEIVSSAGKFAYRASRQPLEEAARDEVGKMLQMPPSELYKYLKELELDPTKIERVTRMINAAKAGRLAGTAIVAHDVQDQGQQ